MCTVFLSYPMNGKTEEEIIQTREEMISKLPSGLKWVDNADCKGHLSDGRLYYLGAAIQVMDKADMIMFHKDWMKAKGCRIEMEVAKEYKIPIIELID